MSGFGFCFTWVQTHERKQQASYTIPNNCDRFIRYMYMYALYLFGFKCVRIFQTIEFHQQGTQRLPPPLLPPLSICIHTQHNTSSGASTVHLLIRSETFSSNAGTLFPSRCVLMLCSGKCVYVRFLSCMIFVCVKNIESQTNIIYNIYT